MWTAAHVGTAAFGRPATPSNAKGSLLTLAITL